MTDNARKEYLNQFFGSKRYLYQDNGASGTYPCSK
ncbi:SAV1978 family virulence-associated passenger protein [Staphylococcus aureus]